MNLELRIIHWEWNFWIGIKKINRAALPGKVNLFEKEKMKPKGRGKYRYDPTLSSEASDFLQEQIKEMFPNATISYIV